MTPIDTLRRWDEAKRRREADPDNEDLIREELEAELEHLNRVGVEIRPQTWYGRHRALVQGVGGSALAVIVALVAWVAYETNQDQNTQGNELNVLVQSSPCSPTKEKPNQPRDPGACKRNFNQAIKSLTPEQSCYILERGAPLIRIGGQEIMRVTCIRGLEPPPKERENKLPATEGGAAGEQSPEQTAQTGAGADKGGSEAPAGPQKGGSGGGKDPAGNDGDGGDGPAGGGNGGQQPEAPAGGGPTGGSGGGEAPGGGSESGGGGSAGGGVVDEATNGLGETVGGVLEGVCTALDRLAGLCHSPQP